MDIDIEKLIIAARAGGDVVKKYFGQTLDAIEKHDASDLRTKADLESEEAILRVLEESFPGYNIFSEEAGDRNNNSEQTIVVDPLDGTNNFVLGVPYVSVSIAVIEQNEILAGVVYNPILDQLYQAKRGLGAWFEGTRLAVNSESSIERASISYMQGYRETNETEGRMVARLQGTNIKRVLTLWSPALDFCQLAAGRIEAVINNKVEIYDYAAGKLIALEAGARITDFQGQELKSLKDRAFIASNNTTLHGELLKLSDI